MQNLISQKDKFIGTFIGLSLGDALGAPYEGGFIERFLWKFFAKTPTGKMRWTDDTQMSIDLAESILKKNNIDQNYLALKFALIDFSTNQASRIRRLEMSVSI